MSTNINENFSRLSFHPYYRTPIKFLFFMQVVMSWFDQQGKKMKRNTFSFLFAILFISQVIASIFDHIKIKDSFIPHDKAPNL